MPIAPGKTKELHKELGAKIHLSIIPKILSPSSFLEAELLCFGQQEHQEPTDYRLHLKNYFSQN